MFIITLLFFLFFSVLHPSTLTLLSCSPVSCFISNSALMDISFAQKIPRCLSGRQQWFCSLLSPACPGPSEPCGHDRPPLMTRCGLALEVGAKWEQVGNLSQWAYHTHTREASTQSEAKERRGRVGGGGVRREGTVWMCGGGAESTSGNSPWDWMMLLEITHSALGLWKKRAKFIWRATKGQGQRNTTR